MPQDSIGVNYVEAAHCHRGAGRGGGGGKGTVTITVTLGYLHVILPHKYDGKKEKLRSKRLSSTGRYSAFSVVLMGSELIL